jgi:hypothetical protein
VSEPTIVTPGNGRRMRSATTVHIDPDRFRNFCWKRRMPLSSIGPLIGRSDSWCSVVISKKHVWFYALDDLASELGIHVDELIEHIGDDFERERMGA